MRGDHDLGERAAVLLAVIALALGLALFAAAAKAQSNTDRFVIPRAPGSFTHIPPGMADPYPHECCHGRDCAPWPVDDVIPRGDGTYFIPSLGAKVGKGMVRPLTREMSQLAIAMTGEATPYHLCIRRDPVTGDPVWHNNQVTVHCFFAGDGM